MFTFIWRFNRVQTDVRNKCGCLALVFPTVFIKIERHEFLGVSVQM